MWCSALLSQGVDDDTWKTLDLVFAIDPATYVMTEGIRYVTAEMKGAQLTLAAIQRLGISWGLMHLH